MIYTMKLYKKYKKNVERDFFFIIIISLLGAAICNFTLNDFIFYQMFSLCN